MTKGGNPMKSCLHASAAAIALALVAGPALAADDISDGVVKIGVLGDMSGVYSTGFSGEGAVAAVKMAVEDFGGTVLGKPIEVISADHQNKADVASATARQWIDENHVDMIADLTNSAVALAVQQLASDKKTITMTTGAATSDLTGKACTKYGIHYGYDTHALPVGTATAVVKNGGDSWYFITADYAFGHALEDNTAAVVKQLGGKVAGRLDGAAGDDRLLLVPAAGAVLGRQGDRAGQCRAGHRQLDQAGARIRHHRCRPAAGGHAGADLGRQEPRHRRRQGAELHHGLVLEPGRRSRAPGKRST